MKISVDSLDKCHSPNATTSILDPRLTMRFMVGRYSDQVSPHRNSYSLETSQIFLSVCIVKDRGSNNFGNGTSRICPPHEVGQSPRLTPSPQGEGELEFAPSPQGEGWGEGKFGSHLIHGSKSLRVSINLVK